MLDWCFARDEDRCFRLHLSAVLTPDADPDQVTRRLAALMLDDAKFHLELRSMFEKPHVVVHPENDRVFDRVLKANSPLSPDLIVRLGWQHYGPNMALVPPESKLVMYIPWEFEAIPTRWVYVMNNYATEVRFGFARVDSERWNK